MSLPLDEPLHAKFLRRPYLYGLSFLFESSGVANGVSVGLSVGLAIVYMFWSGTIGNGDFTDRYASWGEYPGFWLSFYWHPQFTELLSQHGYLKALQATTPLGLKGLYALAAHLQIPFAWFQVGVISVLAMAISGLSCYLTLSILPVPLAGVLASFLTLQSLWSSQLPLVAEPKNWGYLGLLLCFCALNCRGLSPGNTLLRINPFGVPHQNQPPRGLTPFDWLRRLHWPVLSSIVFLALFAPTDLLLVFGVFGLQVMERLAIVPVGRKAQTVQEFLEWSKQQQQNRLAQAQRRKRKKNAKWQFQFRSARLWDLYFPGLGLMLIIGLIYGVMNGWGEVALSRHDMLQQPAFYREGLWAYFYENPWQAWLSGERSGFLPLVTPPLLWTGLVLPLWLQPWGLQKLPLLRQVRSPLLVLGELLLTALVCFVLAHAFVLQLGWPQDFLWVSYRLGLTISSSIFLTAIFEGIAQSLGRSRHCWWGIALGLTIFVVIFNFHFIEITPPANALPTIPSEGLYDRLRSEPANKVFISTLAFRENLALEEQRMLDALQTIAPFYMTPTTLTPYQKFTYEDQRQQLKDLIQAEYLSPRADFLAFLDRLTAGTGAEPIWLVESQRFTLENWSKYSLLQHLYPTLHREITQSFRQSLKTPALPPKGFLQTLLAKPVLDPQDSCRLQQENWIVINLSDRCLPR